MSWTWQGRQLTKAVKDKTVTFTYDSEGIRTSKTVGSTTTKYLLNGTQILAQTTNGKTLCFFYDQQGNRVGMADSSNHFYYYIYNVQGDVIALADASTGKLVVTYTYDAWGKLVELKDTTANSVGTQNPFRYRGYYYDTETSLYYLNSRYYDPDTGRFINADSQLNPKDGVLGCNLFAYCGNNPIINHDPNGHFFFGALIGGIIGGAAGALSASLKGKSIKAGFLTGAVSGAAIGLVCDVVATGGMSAAVGVALCGVISATGNVVNQYANYRKEKNSNSNTEKAKDKANAKSASECKNFAEYVDVKSIAVSSIAAMTFAPLSIGANKVVNIAFEGVETSGLSGFTSQLIANSAMGGSVSILQSMIDLF